MSRKDHTLAYVLGAAGAAVFGYSLLKPDDYPSAPDVVGTAEDFLSGGIHGTDVQTVTGYANRKPFDLTVMGVGNGVYLRVDAAEAFLTMAAAAAQAGVPLRPGSGFRSMASQTALYLKYIGRLFLPPKVAYPGESNHQNGTALDVAGANGKSIGYGSAEFEWLRGNAINYGWSWDEGQKVNEPWHWRYIG